MHFGYFCFSLVSFNKLNLAEASKLYQWKLPPPPQKKKKKKIRICWEYFPRVDIFLYRKPMKRPAQIDGIKGLCTNPQKWAKRHFRYKWRHLKQLLILKENETLGVVHISFPLCSTHLSCKFIQWTLLRECSSSCLSQYWWWCQWPLWLRFDWGHSLVCFPFPTVLAFWNRRYPCDWS